MCPEMPWRAYPGAYLGMAPAVLFYGVVCDPLDEAIELFTDRRGAELVENWNRSEPGPTTPRP
jgi:hypothetical protein